MGKFTRTMLDQRPLAMVGKAERGPAAEAIRDHENAYLVAVGSAAYLVTRALKGSRVAAFENLGMGAIHAFDLREFPVIVAADSKGDNVHQLAERRLIQRA